MKLSKLFGLLNGIKKDAYLSRLLIIVSLSVFLILSVASALTTRSESDEGGFASPALNLAKNKHFGTTVYETEGSPLTRIEQRTYWVLPLFLLNAAVSFKLFGFSLFTLRLVSIFWGFILISSWYFVVYKLSEGNKLLASTSMAFVACNYVFLVNTSLGRGDTMCAALGFAAFATYLSMREKNLLLAIFLSQCLIVGAGLTHFLGILGYLGLLFLTVYYDFRNIRIKHIAVAVSPYIIGGTAFGIWVMQDPTAFMDQFIDNGTVGGRMDGFTSPLNGLIREFTVRYPTAFGLLNTSKGHSGPIFLKSLFLVGYIAGIVGFLFTKKLRQNRDFRAIFFLTLIYFFGLAIIDGQKLSVYLIYIVPLYSVLLAMWVYHMREKQILIKIPVFIGIAGLLALQVGGVAVRCKQNTYGKHYLPAMEYLNQTATDDDLIMGSADLRFALKSTANHIADGAFGMKTGKRPKYIVYDPGIEHSWKSSEHDNPEFYTYFPNLLKNEYEVTYENTAFKVYTRRK